MPAIVAPIAVLGVENPLTLLGVGTVRVRFTWDEFLDNDSADRPFGFKPFSGVPFVAPSSI